MENKTNRRIGARAAGKRTALQTAKVQRILLGLLGAIAPKSPAFQKHLRSRRPNPRSRLKFPPVFGRLPSRFFPLHSKPSRKTPFPTGRDILPRRQGIA